MALVAWCMGCGRSNAEVLLSGSQDRIVMQTTDATLAEVLAAFRSAFALEVKLKGATARTFTGAYSGSVRQVLSRLLTGENYVLRSAADGMSMVLFGSSATASTGEAMGLGLAAVTPQIRRNYNLDDHVNGVLVTRVDPESDAADKGIQPGDVVVSIGNKSVHTPQDIKSQIEGAQHSGRKSVLVLVDGNSGQRFVALKIA